MHELIETSIYCPYCGEPITVLIETLDSDQEYIEDCQVCCRPITFAISNDTNGSPQITVKTENDT